MIYYLEWIRDCFSVSSDSRVQTLKINSHLAASLISVTWFNIQKTGTNYQAIVCISFLLIIEDTRELAYTIS